MSSCPGGGYPLASVPFFSSSLPAARAPPGPDAATPLKRETSDSSNAHVLRTATDYPGAGMQQQACSEGGEVPSSGWQQARCCSSPSRCRSLCSGVAEAAASQEHEGAPGEGAATKGALKSGPPLEAAAERDLHVGHQHHLRAPPVQGFTHQQHIALSI